MRQLLGEPEIPMPYRHPMIVNTLEVFSRKASQTGMVFAGSEGRADYFLGSSAHAGDRIR